MSVSKNDELIMAYLREGFITVDAEAGAIYSTRTDRGKPLAGYLNRDGYVTHHMLYKGTHFKILAHRVIWMSQNGFIPEGKEIDHINRIRNDNRIANLRVVTRFENNLNRREYEIRRVHGEAHHKAKLTAEKVIEIRKSYAAGGISQDKIAALYGVSQSTIGCIIRGEIWRECLPSSQQGMEESA